jgi:hypothetical protein
VRQEGTRVSHHRSPALYSAEDKEWQPAVNHERELQKKQVDSIFDFAKEDEASKHHLTEAAPY